MTDYYLLLETGDNLLQETGDELLLDIAPRGFLVDGTRYDALHANFALTECANRGEVGTGGIDVFDGDTSLTIPALKEAIFNEPAAAEQRVFSGFTHERAMEYVTDADLAATLWAVETVDLNILASDYVLTDSESADRGAETDYVRVGWLLTSRLNSEAGVAVGVVPNTNTVTMEATDYRGRRAADVLAECSEAAGKLWFIYDYGDGRKLYYDLATGTSLTATAAISDVPEDVDGSTIFAPLAAAVKKSPDRIFSKVHLTYNGGTVSVDDSAVASAYRTREAHVLDTSITDEALATVKAEALLAGAAAEITEIDDLTIIMPAANVNDVRAGQRVSLTLTRFGIEAEYHRITRRTVTPLNGPDDDSRYAVTLSLASDVLASAQGARGSYEIWEHTSNATEDGATVTIDRSGLNVIDGAITVVNSGATVIIDGESNMFKIAATGSQSQATSGATSTTLSGLGALAGTPVVLLLHGLSNNVTGLKSLGHFENGFGTFYASLTNGGATDDTISASTEVLRGWAALDGSDECVVSFQAYNSTGASNTRYQYYYALQETAF